MITPGLYIHVPFCETKCSYCDFYSVTSLSDITDYLHAILKEISIYGYEFEAFDTIYIGGGTPSLLSCETLLRLLDHIRKTFSIAVDTEITLEVNPADARPQSLSSWHAAGINRLNLGIQSFDEAALCVLGRRHDSAQALQSISFSRAAGFDNIGLDLIYGIPGQSVFLWENTLRQALSFEPEHLSCYQLSLDGDTPLGRSCLRGDVTLPDENEQADYFLLTSEILECAGYIHYEVSNFARNDKVKSKHNEKYWRHIPYLGIGPAAHSFCGKRRWWNHRSIKRYLSDLHNDRLPIERSERLTSSQIRLERGFLGLRTGQGISLELLLDHSRKSQSDRMGLLNEMTKQGLIVIQDGFLKPTRRGLAVADCLTEIL